LSEGYRARARVRVRVKVRVRVGVRVGVGGRGSTAPPRSFLKADTRSSTKATTSCSLSCWPGLGTTYARGISPDQG
jgi:hypothetical protein